MVLYGAFHRPFVSEIPDSAAKRDAAEEGQVRGRPVKYRDAMTVPDQPPAQMGSEESRATRHQDVHACLPEFVRPIPSAFVPPDGEQGGHTFAIIPRPNETLSLT